MTMENKIISIEKLNKSFGEKIIFKNFDFAVNRSERVGITGPSGCGKTTLLRIISGLDKQYSGNVRCYGKTAYVFQDPALFPWLTAKDNVKAVIKNIGNKKADDAASDLLVRLGLEDDISKYPAELSGGMQRRVSIARAIAYESEIILLDEPFSGLDDETKKSVIELLDMYCKSKTLIIVSHDREELEKITNRTVLIGSNNNKNE